MRRKKNRRDRSGVTYKFAFDPRDPDYRRIYDRPIYREQGLSRNPCIFGVAFCCVAYGLSRHLYPNEIHGRGVTQITFQSPKRYLHEASGIAGFVLQPKPCGRPHITHQQRYRQAQCIHLPMTHPVHRKHLPDGRNRYIHAFPQFPARSRNALTSLPSPHCDPAYFPLGEAQESGKPAIHRMSKLRDTGKPR